MSAVEITIFIVFPLVCFVVSWLVSLSIMLVRSVLDLEKRLRAIEDLEPDGDDPESDDEPVAENVVVLAQRRKSA